MQPLPKKPIAEKPIAELLSEYDYMECDFNIFHADLVRDYLIKLLERCESEKSLEEVKAILKDGLVF